MEIVISIILTMAAHAVVIKISKGRVNRKTHLLSKLFLLIIIAILFALGFVLRTFEIYFVLPLIFISLVYSLYKWLSLTVKRYHDLGYSGWYLLIGSIPVVNFYFLFLLYFGKSDDILNEFDIPIDYLKFLKRNKLYPQIGVIQNCGNDYFINELKFNKNRYNEKNLLQCSSFELDENKSLKKYFSENFVTVENIPGYKNQYQKSFELPEDGLAKIKKDLNALFFQDEYLIIKNVKVYIRKEDFNYAVIYPINSDLQISCEVKEIKHNKEYNHIILSEESLAKIILLLKEFVHYKILSDENASAICQ